MRKLIAIGLTAAFAVAPLQATAAKKAAHQHEQGTIVAPQPMAADGTCIYRGQRAVMGLSNGAAPNGVLGYTFYVDPKTAGKKFKLEVDGGAGMDISFYSELGDPADPTTAPANMPYETPGPGGEAGTVPAGMPIAFVCMTEGQNAAFTYMAGKGVK